MPDGTGVMVLELQPGATYGSGTCAATVAGNSWMEASSEVEHSTDASELFTMIAADKSALTPCCTVTEDVRLHASTAMYEYVVW